METTFSIIQIVLAVLVTVGILLQRSQGGLEGAIGGGSSSDNVIRKRRGSERVIYEMTLGLTILFLASNLLPLILGQ